ncbi:MAG TPA: NAD(P)H-binding protein [Terriglobales bacterium]|nr:NAD(P)H-binding protein [Terriglobales bacterium]
MDVFITGGTGYIGNLLISELVQRGHKVRALVRPGSEGKLPPGAQPVLGNALDADSYADKLSAGDTLVQLVGVPHPSPAKAAQFRAVDLPSGLAAAAAAKKAGVRHLVYVSVAHPAPVMKAYIAVRAQVEQAIRDAALNATILRPWYVLGPGHCWPYLVLPLYKFFELLPPTREGAQRLGLVKLAEMVAALVRAVEEPVEGVRVVEVPEIRNVGRRDTEAQRNIKVSDRQANP